MKKILLSLSAAVACMSMSAAVPTLQDQFNGSFNVTQENPNYSNPSAYDANGNLIITGAFNDMFGNLEAIGTSAYIVKYDKSNAQQWTVALTGSATITAIDTDAAGNIYVAGTLADEVEFGTTSGDAIIKAGMSDGADGYTVGQNASFIAKYDAAGKLCAVRNFVPETLAALSGQYSPEDGDLYFTIGEIKVDDNKVYAVSTCTGEITIDNIKIESSYNDLLGWGIYSSIPTLTAIALDCESLTSCEKVASVQPEGPLFEDSKPIASSLRLTVDNGNLYASFVCEGTGVYNYGIGGTSNSLILNGSENYYVVFSKDSKCVLKQNKPESSAPANQIRAMYVNNGMLYIVGTAMGTIPALEISENAVKTAGVSDPFVACFDASSLSLKSMTVKDVNEGTTMIPNWKGELEEKPNYEIVSSTGIIDGALYINTEVYNGNQEFLNMGASYWFDGAAFSAAPVAATGIAVGNGVAALIASDATKVDYSTYTFTPTQSGISGIEADFDENAPVEYFNLQGIRVANPENGLYIRRQGNKVEKVIL